MRVSKTTFANIMMTSMSFTHSMCFVGSKQLNKEQLIRPIYGSWLSAVREEYNVPWDLWVYDLRTLDKTIAVLMVVLNFTKKQIL